MSDRVRLWVLGTCCLCAACGEESPAPSPAGLDAATQESPSSFAGAVPRFTDVLADSAITFRHHFIDSESGNNYRLNPYDHGSGVCVVDVNGDGKDDIYLLDFLGDNALYLNTGDFKFRDVTAAAGVAVARALSVGAAFGDYDNDGDPDLYVTTYRGGNHLFNNDGAGIFTDVTQTAGVGYKGHSNGATWLDYDLDADLDLFLCNIGKFTAETISQEADYFYTGVALPFLEVVKTPDGRNPGEGCILYQNNGDGTFTDATKSAGIGSDEWNGDAAVADIDLDGDLDLYTSNMFGPNHLYRNQGSGTFEEITDAALQRTSWGGMGARFFDANGDAFPDLYVVDMHSDMGGAPIRASLVVPNVKYDTPGGTEVPGGKVIRSPEETRAKTVLFGNTYFQNSGDGNFVEKSASANLETYWPWGIAVGDFNDDGTEDVFVPSGMGYPYFYWPNCLLLNDGSGKFTECATRAGVEPPAAGPRLMGADIKGQPFPRSSRAAAVSDLDGDGDLDLVVNNFNHEPYLFRNDSPPGNALRLNLRNKSKGTAWGARVKVSAGSRTFSRELANAQGYLTQSSGVLHVGLGAADRVDQVEVFWLGATTAQVVRQPALDRVVTVDQE